MTRVEVKQPMNRGFAKSHLGCLICWYVKAETSAPCWGERGAGKRDSKIGGELRASRSENDPFGERAEMLFAMIAELESRLGANSTNPSMLPSSGSITQRAELIKSRSERRAAAKVARKVDARSRGKQPGARGSNLERVPRSLSRSSCRHLSAQSIALGAEGQRNVW